MSEPDISALARRLAEQNNVDWRALLGSGPSGKVVERDVLDFLARVMAGDEAVDPTPEPLPAGMEAWPDQDLNEFRQGVSESASSLGDLRNELGSSARVESAFGAADGFSAQETVTATGPLGPGSVSVTESLADDDEVSEDIFLFDDEVAGEATDEGPGAYAAAPYVEVPASVVDEDDDLLDDDLLVAGDDGQMSLDDLDTPGGTGEVTGYANDLPGRDSYADARSDGSGAFGSLSTASLTADEAGAEELFGAADDTLTFDGFGAEPSFGAAAGASQGDAATDSFAGGWGETTRIDDEPSDWERLNGLSNSAQDGSDEDLPDLFTDESELDTGMVAASEGAEPAVAYPAEADSTEDESAAFESIEEESFEADSTEDESTELESIAEEIIAADSVAAAEPVSDGPDGSAGAVEEVEMEEAAEQPVGYAGPGAGVEPAVVAAAAAQVLDLAAREDPALAALPLARPAMLLRRHIDVSALAAAQLAVGQELGQDEPLGAAPFLLRAVAKAAMEIGFTPNPVALAVIDGGIRLRRVDDAATRSFGSLIGEMQAGEQDEDEAGLVAADLSGIDVDEVVLELGVPVVTLGRILYDTQRGAYRSTLALAGDVPLEIGAKLLARVAELLDAPVRLVL